ncbi:MAG: very short patch repair endonuclease [Bifidobacteriaceae bacterium]|nr:very short patch repair endonuclease [Bifidobacteriaceae bacterium]
MTRSGGEARPDGTAPAARPDEDAGPGGAAPMTRSDGNARPCGTASAVGGGAKGSWASSDATRRSMQANRSRDTGPEMAVRRLLFARGLRYRVAFKPVKGERMTADIVFPGRRVAVFIDGCFWHGCPEHHRLPKTHTDYWQSKIARNTARDTHVAQVLETAGWTVLRFWEHEDPAEVAERIANRVQDHP